MPGLKSETFNFDQYLSVYIFTQFFLHNLGVLHSNQSDKILDLVPCFAFKIAKQKWPSKPHFLLFYLSINTQCVVSA